MVAKDNRGGQLLARHRIRLVCLEPFLDGLSLVSLPKDGLDRVSHQLERALVHGMRGVATVHGI